MEIKEPALAYYKQSMTPEEYLEFERNATEKHEYINGELLPMNRAYEGVYAMAGARLRHVRLVSKLQGELFVKLKDKACEVLTNDLRLSVKNAKSYFYPDLVILCQKEQMLDKTFDTLLNPQIIIEVLSKGTADYDLGRKQFIYMQIPSLQEMAFVDSNSMNVKVSRRRIGGTWEMEELTEPEQELALSTIPVTLALNDIYNGIIFEGTIATN
ncbi:Uma2 family endonuclease [Danxiaibacter flavus]|uniref:Uma2 family endonuclease n=1 Tax=Danxiaibacter flavus TaxID=3049108 RepID=A0ABV3ZLV6_9BACT|nr:Uma2 family endonuclease [Chitinophagaceae bacterium DXS]